MVEHSNLIFDKNDYYLSEKDLHLIIAKHVKTVKDSLPFFNFTSSWNIRDIIRNAQKST